MVYWVIIAKKSKKLNNCEFAILLLIERKNIDFFLPIVTKFCRVSGSCKKLGKRLDHWLARSGAKKNNKLNRSTVDQFIGLGKNMESLLNEKSDIVECNG